MPAATSKTTPAETVAAPKKKAAEPVSTVINNDAVFASADSFANAAREQMETLMGAFTGNTEEMREKAEAMNEEMRTRFEKTQQHVSDMNNELMEAARTEMNEAVQFANDMTQAKSVADALEIQRGYFMKLFQTRIERARHDGTVRRPRPRNCDAERRRLHDLFRHEGVREVLPVFRQGVKTVYLLRTSIVA